MRLTFALRLTREVDNDIDVYEGDTRTALFWRRRNHTRDDLFSNLIQANQEGFGSGDADDDQDVSGKLRDDELMGAFYTSFHLSCHF